MNLIFFCKTFDQILPVLMDSFEKIAGDANVQSAVLLTSQNIDIVRFHLMDPRFRGDDNKEGFSRRQAFNAASSFLRGSALMGTSGRRRSSRQRPRCAIAALIGMGLVSKNSARIKGNSCKWISCARPPLPFSALPHNAPLAS